METELKIMDEMLVNPDHVKSMQVYEDYEQLKSIHDKALEAWEKQTVILEKMQQRRN